jgi:polar amino acid transport system substrate-binding protein
MYRNRGTRTSAIGFLISSALLVSTLAACSSSSSSSSAGSSPSSGTSAPSTAQSGSLESPAGDDSSTSVDSAARALLPASITSSNTITVASSIGFAPFELYAADGKTPEGLDIDLIHAIEPILGVTFKINDVRYPNILPSLQAKRYDIGWSAFGEDADSAKVVDFVTYLSDSSGDVLVPAAAAVATQTDLCGKSIGQVNGEPLDTINAINKACSAANKPALKTKNFQKTADIVLALESGQLDARLTDDANGGYIAQQSGGKLKIVSGVLPAVKSYTGVVALKGQTGVEQALSAALQDTINDGQYAKVLAKWGGAKLALPKIVLGLPSA